MAGDILRDGNQDGAINFNDIMQVAKFFNAASSSSLYNPDCDINKDNVINMTDIMIVAKHFNTYLYT